MQKFYYSIIFIVYSLVVKAQINDQTVEMADVMRSNGKIYVVVAVLSIIFAGIIVYLVNLDRKISNLEKRIK